MDALQTKSKGERLIYNIPAAAIGAAVVTLIYRGLPRHLPCHFKICHSGQVPHEQLSTEEHGVQHTFTLHCILCPFFTSCIEQSFAVCRCGLI